MMQGLQSFVRRHGYLLYNIDIDQDNPFYEPMETFSCVYFPNAQVLYFQCMNTEVTVALTTIE